MEAPHVQEEPGAGVGSLDIRRATEALAAVSTWRESANAKHRRELQEVDEELTRLAAAIEDLQRQLTALGDFRSELVSREQAILSEEQRRAHEGLFEALDRQGEDLSVRARTALAADTKRVDAIQDALSDSEVAGAWKEYQDFIHNAEAISQLPSSYRTALALHHEATAARLSEAVRAADPGPTKLDEAPLELDVLYTIGTSGEQEPELVSLVLPVREEVWTDWADRPDDLQLQVAARVAQALFEAVQALGNLTAQSIQGGHQGLLAIELELAGPEASALRDRFETTLAEVASNSPELVAARVSLKPVHVPVSYLLPPDPDAEANDDR